MNVVIWTANRQRFAIPTSQVVEVVPIVQARALIDAPKWMRGLINYRGSLLPLVDASALLGREVTAARMTGRILVMEPGGSNGAARRFGLLVETLLWNEEVDFEDPSGHDGAAQGSAGFLGPVALTPSGTIQLIVAERIPVSSRAEWSGH